LVSAALHPARVAVMKTKMEATPARSPGLRLIVDPPGVIAPGILMIFEMRSDAGVIIRRECGNVVAMLK
jgi:hypothetical protein